ncbi:MAG TPA: hypothetical protein VJ044_00200 [Candidatus Hodarchaeales archaeon]|nr:hypothetical protein [Candidatus Hodarchaeales archaeon]
MANINMNNVERLVKGEEINLDDLLSVDGSESNTEICIVVDVILHAYDGYQSKQRREFRKSLEKKLNAEDWKYLLEGSW